QAEDGIRDKLVTGVQTCALPISVPQLYAILKQFRSSCIRPECAIVQDAGGAELLQDRVELWNGLDQDAAPPVQPFQRIGVGLGKIGRASCRERVKVSGGVVDVEE